MQKRFKFIATIIAVSAMVFIATSCYYDNEEVLYPSIGAACDTTNVTYSGTISKIIDDNCNSCHGASYNSDGNGIRLDSYSNLQAKLSDVISSINHLPSKEPMPKNTAKLNDCKLRQFDIWIAAGSPNN